MALRNLVARTRTTAAAALRLPPPPLLSVCHRRLPASLLRRALAQDSTAPLRVDSMAKETASEEEVRRQADLVGKEIDETEERLSVYREKIPIIWKDIWGSMRLWVVSCAAMQLMLFVDSRLRTVVEPEE